MATEVIVPALGESISSGILATWHIKDGDHVEKGQTIFDLETDKITSEGTAEVSGKISLKVDEGDEVEVGATIAEIDESASGDSEKSSSEDSSKEEPKEEKPSEDKKETAEDSAPKSDHQSPAVRRIVEETGVDPSTVEGSGKGGRVTKGDLVKHLEDQPKSSETSSKESSAPSPSPSSNAERTTRKKMTPLRRTIAQRLVEAQQTTAMLTTFNEVDMSAVMEIRKKYQDNFVKKNDVKLGFMSFFTKAVVQALKDVPAVNAQIEGQEIIQNHFYDIGIAVSTPKGLMVPVIKDCDSKEFAQIEKDIIHYATKAKDGKIGIEDLQGGVFTITNGGIFGSMLSTPILNTPQSAILGMHTIQQRPVAVNGEVVIRPMMYLALSYDHRIVDGREAVTFLVKVKEAIEDPTRLLFGV